jgi:ornithine cyclodeaminase/alanine dehydrogenase-like protein (mu-crystallin family)
MLILNNDEIETLLSMDSCIEVLDKAYRQLANGEAVNRPRTDLYLPFPETSGVYVFKSMEAGLFDPKVVALRLNSDVIRWEDRGGRIVKDKLPKAPGGKWVGLVLLFSAETGEPLAIFPDGVIQAFRVAASSALAARYLARPDVNRLGVFGSGWQARAHVEAFCNVRSFEKVLVFSPTRENRESFALEMANRVGLPVEPCAEAAQVAEQAQVLVAATNTITRVIPPEWVKPGVHFTCVKTSELGDDTIARADRVVIHTRKIAPENYIAGLGDEKVEAHDPIDFLTAADKQAVSRPKAPSWIHAPELKDVVAGKLAGRTRPDESTCFVNNIGLGVQFAAVGSAVYEDAKTQGLGREIPTEWFLESVHP